MNSQNGLIQRETLKTFLQENVLSVVFLKKDGSERVLECTLKPELIPQQEATEASSTTKRTENMDVLQVYDLENNGWRSFRIDSVLAFMIRNNDGN